MKRFLKAFVFMLVALMSFSLTVSANGNETRFEENGITYCWLRGSANDKPESIPGYRWVSVFEEDDNGKLKKVTRLGDCITHENNQGCDLFCAQRRIEYKFQLMEKEVFLIEALSEEDYSMVGTQFKLVKYKIKTNSDGSITISNTCKSEFVSVKVDKKWLRNGNYINLAGVSGWGMVS